jgi:hypothetical protein
MHHIHQFLNSSLNGELFMRVKLDNIFSHDLASQKLPPLSTTVKQQPAQQFQHANAELEMRNRKLEEPLVKSHEVYASPFNEHRKLPGDRQNQQRGIDSFVVFDMNEIERSRKRISTSAQKEAKLVKAAYLRRVVLQFFSQEMESERNNGPSDS